MENDLSLEATITGIALSGNFLYFKMFLENVGQGKTKSLASSSNSLGWKLSGPQDLFVSRIFSFCQQIQQTIKYLLIFISDLDWIYNSKTYLGIFYYCQQAWT